MENGYIPPDYFFQTYPMKTHHLSLFLSFRILLAAMNLFTKTPMAMLYMLSVKLRRSINHTVCYSFYFQVTLILFFEICLWVVFTTGGIFFWVAFFWVAF